MISLYIQWGIKDKKNWSHTRILQQLQSFFSAESSLYIPFMSTVSPFNPHSSDFILLYYSVHIQTFQISTDFFGFPFFLLLWYFTRERER